MNDYMNIGDVAEYLKLPEETVYKYARTGVLPAAKVGKHWRFERKRIDEWLSDRMSDGRGGLRILVVDDEAPIRQLLERWLVKEGHEVFSASDGEEALTLVQHHTFDLILLDLRMPRMDGSAFLVKAKEEGLKAQIVIHTAFFDSELMDRALEYGPLFVLRKPVERKELLGIVNTLSSKRGRK